MIGGLNSASWFTLIGNGATRKNSRKSDQGTNELYVRFHEEAGKNPEIEDKLGRFSKNGKGGQKSY